MFVKLDVKDKGALYDLGRQGYQFNWSIASSERSITVAAVYNGDVSGLVEYERQPENLANYMWLIEVSDLYKGTGIAGKLLAYVGKDALEQGFNGFFFFEAKTIYYNHFIKKYGAIPVTSHRLYFDTKATNNLISKYLEGEKYE